MQQSILSHTESHNTFFNTDQYTKEFIINPVPDHITAAEWLQEAFQQLYDKMRASLPHDFVRAVFKFSAPGMTQPANCNMSSLDNFTFDKF